MTQTYTTQDGKTAVPVNPYKLTKPGSNNNPDPKREGERLFKLREFNANNPPLSLTTERPDLIGKEFYGEVVEQGSDDKINWYPSGEDCPFYSYTRQAISVPVKGEKNKDQAPDIGAGISEDSEIVVGLGGPAKAHISGFQQLICFSKGNVMQGVNELTFSDFIKIAKALGFAPNTHATNDANLVPLDKVVNILEGIKWNIEVYLFGVFDRKLNEAITQIKQLKTQTDK